MNRILRSLLSAFALFACLPSSPVLSQKLSKTDEAWLDSLMAAKYAPHEPGGVILVARDGKPLYRKAFGLADAELGVPNKADFSFKVGSISKQFTAVSMLMLAQEGKVDLDAEVRTYLPWFDPHGRTITVRNLLTHTSGVPSYTEKEGFDAKATTDVSKQEIVEYVMGDSLLFEPGTDWSYSNTGYALANLVIEKVSGISFEQFLRTRIFGPLRMTHSYTITGDSVLPGLVYGYDKAGPGSYKPTSFLAPTWPYGGGQVISSVDDMLAWDEALYSDALVRAEWLQKAWTSFTLANGEKTNYGFGWAIGSYKGVEIITHAGGINGFVSDGVRIPSKHVYVIQISNNTSASPDMVKEIALWIAGMPYRKPGPVAMGTDAMKDLEGVYELRRSGGRLTTNTTSDKQYRTLTVENDTVYAQPTGGSRRMLVPVGKDLFTIGESSSFMKVVRNASGKVSALDVYQEPVNYGPHSIETRTEKPVSGSPEYVTVDPSVLKDYRGKYQLAPGFIIEITTDGGRIYGQATGQAKFEMFATSPTTFRLKVVDASVEFLKDETGRVNTMILNQSGRHELKRVD